jgi:hypothetical protein
MVHCLVTRILLEAVKLETRLGDRGGMYNKEEEELTAVKFGEIT